MSDRLPWLCPQCGGFSTKPLATRSPTHDCPAAGHAVTLIAYQNSTQAESLRHSVTASR